MDIDNRISSSKSFPYDNESFDGTDYSGDIEEGGKMGLREIEINMRPRGCMRKSSGPVEYNGQNKAVIPPNLSGARKLDQPKKIPGFLNLETDQIESPTNRDEFSLGTIRNRNKGSDAPPKDVKAKFGSGNNLKVLIDNDPKLQ